MLTLPTSTEMHRPANGREFIELYRFGPSADGLNHHWVITWANARTSLALVCAHRLTLCSAGSGNPMPPAAQNRS